MTESKKINVLMIEDNPADARLVSVLLSTDCPDTFDLSIVDRLEQGLELIKTQQIDVVLTDLTLPDSHETLTLSKIQETNAGLPIVVLSGHQSEKLAMQVVKAGAQDYLVKGQGDGFLISKSLRYAIERKRIQQGLAKLAQYDSLTGLPNRSLFRERLSRAMIRADRNRTLVGLMFIDLDRFKNINDTLGHDAGDQLLIEVGNRLKHCIRDGDTVARLGGDEFTIIVEDIKQVDAGRIVAKKILDVMQAPINLSGQDVFVTPSIGITMYPLDDKSDKALLKNADTAMYQAKEYGRNGFQFYTTGMNKRTLERLALEAQLRQALANNEFVLYYQPKIKIDNGEIFGVEALIRWHQPELGMVSPAEFIPLAEETGLIIPIGIWVLRQACEQVSRWHAIGFPDIRMAINLSPRQFIEPDIAKDIMEVITDINLEPKHLEFEITESMMMKDADFAALIIKVFKKQGIHISIDDFGTGYSSLSYLKRFKVDSLKIDQSFVRDMMTDPDDAAITTAIIALGKSLHLNVIAEGVETEEQLEFLKSHGCNEAQGYLFSKPVPAHELTQLLEQQNINNTQQHASNFA